MKFDPWHLVWLLLLAIAIVLCYIGFFHGNWISPHAAASGGLDSFELACSPIMWCISGECNRFDSVSDIPFMWWQVGACFMGIGIVIMMVGFLGALITIFAQTFQPIAHNIQILGGVLALVGLICISVGMKDMGADFNATVSDIISDPKSCRICESGTSLFYLVDCSIDDGFIIMIIGVIVECIAGCVGWNVNHRKDAPPAYRERGWTGMSRRPGRSAPPQPHVVGEAPPAKAKWMAPRPTYNKRNVNNPLHEQPRA